MKAQAVLGGGLALVILSGCGYTASCRTDVVRVNFPRVELQGAEFFVELRLGARAWRLTCPRLETQILPDNVMGSCASEHVVLEAEDLGLRRVEEATLSIRTTDGRFLAQEVRVQLTGHNPVNPDGLPGVCGRYGTATF